MSPGALDGVRILDFTRVLSGPYGTMLLADQGADVVKVEPPGGDDTRAFGPPFVGGVSTYFLSINRGKRSVVADLKDPAQRDRVRALALAADVVVENYRPGVMTRLGLDADDLMAENPRLIWCAITGFGRGREGPGYDLIIQGMSGIPSITGAGDVPWKCGASIADLVAGMNAAQGITAALLRRERTGQGSYVDVSMMDGQLSLLAYHATAWLNAAQAPRARGNQHPSIHPFRAYRAADGWLNLAVGNDRLFAGLCAALEVAWHRDRRFATNAARVANRAALDALLEPRIAARPVAHWIAALQPHRVPAGPMASVPDALERARPVTHDHPTGADPVRTLPPGVRLEGTPWTAERRAPALGEHTEAVFAEWVGGTPGLASPSRVDTS
ncbi:MAG: CoA transferase [Alphaproteobacteria bacterium]|nr:CoA transferase [Alphaproteobacteria bacterium]